MSEWMLSRDGYYLRPFLTLHALTYKQHFPALARLSNTDIRKLTKQELLNILLAPQASQSFATSLSLPQPSLASPQTPPRRDDVPQRIPSPVPFVDDLPSLESDEDDEKYPISDLTSQFAAVAISDRPANVITSTVNSQTETLLGLTIHIDKNRVFYKDEVNKKVYYFLDSTKPHSDNVYKTVLSIWSNVSPYKTLKNVPETNYAAYCNNDGVTANFILNVLPNLEKGFQVSVYAEDNDYLDKYLKVKLMTNKYFVPRNGGFLNKTFYGFTFDRASDSLSTTPEVFEATINAYIYFFKQHPEKAVKQGQSIDYYKLLYSTESSFFSNSFSYGPTLKFRNEILTNNSILKPCIFTWDKEENKVVKVDLPVKVNREAEGTKHYSIKQADFNRVNKIHLLIYYISRNVLVSNVAQFVELTLQTGVVETLTRYFDIQLLPQTYSRTVPGIARGTMFPFTQLQQKERHPPRTSNLTMSDLESLSFKDLVAVCREHFVSTNVLMEEIGEGLSKTEAENRARPLLIARFLRAMKERQAYSGKNKKEGVYDADFGFMPGVGTVFTGKDISQSLEAKQKFQTLGDHVIGEYDLDLSWKPHDYKWNPYVKIKLDCDPNNITLNNVDWAKVDLNFTTDGVEFDTVFEYAAQAKANAIIAKAYGQTPEWVEQTVRTKRSFPDLSSDKAKALFDELSVASVTIDDTTYECSTDYIVTSGQHQGYHVTYGQSDIQPLLPSNVYFVLDNKGLYRTYFITSSLQRWEMGFASFDYIAYRVMPMYPRDFVTEQLVDPATLCQVLNVAEKRGFLQDYPICKTIIKPNMSIMQQLYWWDKEYDASDRHYQRFAGTDMAAWNKRDIMAIYYLDQIAEQAQYIPKVLGYRKYSFMESAKQNPAVFMGCLLKEMILSHFTLQMELPDRTVRWIRGEAGDVEKNRSYCEREEQSHKNPCNPCYNNKVATNIGTHEWLKF